jgi:hypothetical protein
MTLQVGGNEVTRLKIFDLTGGRGDAAFLVGVGVLAATEVFFRTGRNLPVAPRLPLSIL